MNNFYPFTFILDFATKRMLIWSKNLNFRTVFHLRSLLYTQIKMIRSNLTDLKYGLQHWNLIRDLGKYFPIQNL